MCELPLVEVEKRHGTKFVKELIFNKTSAQIVNLVYKSWLCQYPCSRYMIYNNGSEFKLYFCELCDTYNMKHKPTTVKNSQLNAILERVHDVIVNMLRTSELDMSDSVSDKYVSLFIADAS